MAEPQPPELTRLLQAAEDGDADAADRLFRLVYAELRRLAQAQMVRASAAHTLQPTALVHEAFMRLMGREDPRRSESRRHFFAAVARAMHDIVVEQARSRGCLKRGQGRQRLDEEHLEQVALTGEVPELDLLALDEALHELEQSESRCAEVVKLRFWAGLGMPDIAELLGVSVPTVERDWRFAKAFLYSRLSEKEATA